MKNASILLLIFVSSFSFLLAQEQMKTADTREQTIDKKNWRAILRIQYSSSWSGAFNAVKPISDKWFLRLGLSPFVDVRTQKNNFSNEEQITESLTRNRSWGLNFGIGTEYHFATKGKLDPYIGLGANFGFELRRVVDNRNIEYLEPDFLGLIRSEFMRVNKEVPFITVSPFVAFGVNYFITPRFAIGAEYGIGPNFKFRKGKDNITTTETLFYEDGSELVLDNEGEPRQQTEFITTLGQRVGFNIIYVLNKGKKK